MDAFLAIERVLLVHHSTTRQPMNIGALRFRAMKAGTVVSNDDIARVRAIWPEAYSVYKTRGQLVIECPDLPHAADRRRAVFLDLWKQKENMVVPSAPVCCSSLDTSPEPLALLPTPANVVARGASPTGGVTKTPRRILTGKPRRTHASDSNVPLLERIRAKEARLQVLRSPQNIQKQTDSFLTSQIPKLRRVLGEIANAKDLGILSFDIERLMEILRENMVKLGDDELQRCLELLSAMHPSFCAIVSSGNSTFVRLTSEPIPLNARQQESGPDQALINDSPQRVVV